MLRTFTLWCRGSDASFVAQDFESVCRELRPFLGHQLCLSAPPCTSFLPESRSMDGTFLWFPGPPELLLRPPPHLLSCLGTGTPVTALQLSVARLLPLIPVILSFIQVPIDSLATPPYILEHHIFEVLDALNVLILRFLLLAPKLLGLGPTDCRVGGPGRPWPHRLSRPSP